MRSKFFKLLLLIIALFLMISAASAAEDPDTSLQFEQARAFAAPGSGLVVEPKDAAGPEIYIVVLDKVPLASYRGGIKGLEATNPSATGESKLNVESSASTAYLDYLDGQRTAAIDSANHALGRELDIAYEYGAAMVGYAAEMTPSEAAVVAQLDNVRFVQRDQEFELHTDAGPAWIGAPGIWDGSATGIAGFKGEGIIVGVIDTGIDPWNPSFADVGDDGYDHTNPNGPGNYFGVCDPTNTSPPAGVEPYDPTFPCNDKLIGAWGYESLPGTPRDANGHGSHTASTAAGNVVNNSVVSTPTDTYTATISGVAPHANIVMYAACCTGSALSAARDQVVLDGVDVVNYSIGASAPTTDPWADAFALQWLAVRDAGIFVATSAGNNGPGDSTVGSPGDLPWMTTVGASSHNRVFLQELTLDDGGGTSLTLHGQAMTSGFGPAQVVFARDYADPDGGISEEDANLCADGIFPPGTFSGEIVVCERGTYGRVAKGQTVKDGGAGGYVLAQPDEFGGGPGAVATDPHVLPAIHIDYYEYQALLEYMDVATSTVNGTFSGATLDVNDGHGDVMAAFSSRGPNGGFFNDLIVPNVTAPGRAIWAAYHQGAGGDGDYTWNVIQGTSMSSPHVAGAGALLAGVHPDWTPAQIESALSSTAFQDVINDDGVNQATPFAMGGGRIDLVAATQAGLLLDVSTSDFEDSDPRTGGDPKSLNIANMGNAQCVVECSWTRTFSNPTASTVSWTAMVEVPEGATGAVSPESFDIAPGATQEVMVTVGVGSLDADTWYFGDLKLMTDAEGVSDAHLPIAFQPSKGDIPEQELIKTRRNAGSQTIHGITSIPAAELTMTESGLAQGMQYDLMLPQDPNNGDPYDPIDAVWFKVFDVPEGTARFVAETPVSTAPDIDLFVGTGDTPGADTQVCASTSSSFNEYCNLDNPEAGQYWVLVQNWDGSGADYDSVKLFVGIVNGDAGNMTVTGPSSVGALEPYDLLISYDEDMAAGQRWYGAVALGTTPTNVDDIGTINIDLHRYDDDVTKSVSPGVAMPGDIVTFTIKVEPNVTPEDLTYTVIDTIPDGLTLVPGSATATAGSITAGLDTVFWSGTQISPVNAVSTYEMATSNTDPNCAAPLANDGAYVNLEAFGIMTQAGIEGDTVTYFVDPSGGEFEFFGELQGEIFNFTDDGFAFFDPSSSGATPWAHQPIPTADDPNNLMAMFWRDMEIVYDGPTNRGISIANLTTGGVPSAVIVEYDDVEDWPAGTNPTYDFEVIAYYEASPDRYEYIFAYTNLTGPVTTGTIGLENAAGTEGVQYAYDDIDVTDGMAVCFDQVGGNLEAVEITYQVTVDADAPLGVLNNHVVSMTSNPGSEAATAKSGVYVGYPTFMPAIAIPDPE